MEVIHLTIKLNILTSLAVFGLIVCTTLGDSNQNIDEKLYLFQNPDLQVNDSILLAYIRQHHLFPPSNRPYQLRNGKINPAVYQEAIETVFKKQRNGFFVDCGAHAGEWHSNTLELERNYGWTGLLMEPNPKLLKQLLRKERKAWATDTCLFGSSTPHQLNYVHYKNEKEPRMGRVLGVNDEFGPIIEKDVMQPHRYKLDSADTKTPVACFPLESLLLALNRTTMDYLSINVAGDQLSMLDHIPLEKLKTTFVSVGFLGRINGFRKANAYMKTRGYTLLGKSEREAYFKFKGTWKQHK